MLPANMHVIWRASHDAAFSLLNQLSHDFKRIAGVLEKLRLAMGFVTQFHFVTRFLGLFIVLRVGVYFFGGGFLEVGTKKKGRNKTVVLSDNILPKLPWNIFRYFHEIIE